MSRVLLGRPPAPPPPPEQPAWLGLELEWTGWDGSQWPLHAPESGLLLRREGVRGLAMPAFTRYTDTSPALPGSRWRGAVALEREVFWPLYLYSDAGHEDWLRLDRAFWRTMHPERTGVWSVTTPDGGTRTLAVRFVDDSDHAFALDPVRFGWAAYGVHGVAERPFWRGPKVRRSFGSSEGGDFFGPGGFGPPFFVSSSSRLDAATIDNPGDEPAAPRYFAQGPFTAVTLGLGSRTLQVPAEVAQGRMLVVDTDPAEQTAIEVNSPPPPEDLDPDSEAWEEWLGAELAAGVERTDELGAVEFARVPAGSSVPLILAMEGTGKVDVELIPQHHRAW